MRKHEFLTIPDAPNYEINGYFKVRNKKTGKFLKRGNRGQLDFWMDGRHLTRMLAVLYRQALAAVTDNDEYAEIPSFNNRYEINFDGVVRNSRTKYRLKCHCTRGCSHYRLSKGGKIFVRTRASLLNEVFDKNIFRLCRPIPVILRENSLAYYFKSLSAGARFVQSKTGNKFPTIRNKMTAREKEIYGWQATYLG